MTPSGVATRSINSHSAARTLPECARPDRERAMSSRPLAMASTRALSSASGRERRWQFRSPWRLPCHAHWRRECLLHTHASCRRLVNRKVFLLRRSSDSACAAARQRGRVRHDGRVLASTGLRFPSASGSMRQSGRARGHIVRWMITARPACRATEISWNCARRSRPRRRIIGTRPRRSRSAKSRLRHNRRL